MRPFKIMKYDRLNREQRFLQTRDFMLSILREAWCDVLGDESRASVHRGVCTSAFEWLDDANGGRPIRLYPELRRLTA